MGFAGVRPASRDRAPAGRGRTEVDRSRLAGSRRCLQGEKLLLLRDATLNALLDERNEFGIHLTAHGTTSCEQSCFHRRTATQERVQNNVIGQSERLNQRSHQSERLNGGMRGPIFSYGTLGFSGFWDVQTPVGQKPTRINVGAVHLSPTCFDFAHAMPRTAFKIVHDPDVCC